MSGVFFIYYCSFYFLIILVTIQYLYKFNSNLVYGVKKLWKFKQLAKHYFFLSYYDVIYYIIAQFILFFTLKVKKTFTTFVTPLCLLYIFTTLVLIFVLALILKIFVKETKDIHTLLISILFLYLGLTTFIHINNFLIFLLAVEVIGTTYYFFFLTQIMQHSDTFLKFKNALSLYLWTSFCVLCFLGATLLTLIYYCGTLDFAQLLYLSQNIPSIVWHFLFLGLGWKVGVAGFQFFKLELYNFLPLYTILLFSIFTLFINYFILNYILVIFWPIFFFNKAVYIIYLLTINILLLMRVQSNILFSQFLAYSGVNTWATIFLFALI